MAILFASFLVLSLLTGFFDGFASASRADQVRYAGAMLASVLFGIVAEVGLIWWLFRPAKGRVSLTVTRIIVGNWGFAIAVAVLALVLLASPLFDRTRAVYLVVGLIFTELVAVSAFTAQLSIRAAVRPRVRSGVGRFLNSVVLNVVSMLVGVAAGRVSFTIL